MYTRERVNILLEFIRANSAEIAIFRRHTNCLAPKGILIGLYLNRTILQYILV